MTDKKGMKMVLCALVALCGGAQAGPVVSLKGGQLEGVGTAGMGSFFLGVPFALATTCQCPIVSQLGLPSEVLLSQL